jgi:guanine nucleotide-binding protein subunit beta-2-like 1 protein
MDKAEIVEDPNTRFRHVGNLEGHNDWVTCISSGNPLKENEDSPILVSGSRDRTLMIWKLTGADESDDSTGNRLYGVPLKSMTGHNHFISDLAMSADNLFALTSSWDRTLRLWDLRAGKTSRSFVGHTKEVHSVTFSLDNRQIISAGADKTFKLWNTLADCKYTNEHNNHSDWISCVRYSPVAKNPYFATSGWDGRLKIWQSNFLLKYSFKAHNSQINSLAIAPLGSYVATGGKENVLKLWDINDLSEEYRTLNTGASINKVAFNPIKQWIAAAADNGVHIFDLNNESDEAIAKLIVEKPKKKKETKLRAESYACTSLCWSTNGRKLFAGFTDNIIRVYDVNIDERS